MPVSASSPSVPVIVHLDGPPVGVGDEVGGVGHGLGLGLGLGDCCRTSRAPVLAAVALDDGDVDGLREGLALGEGLGEGLDEGLRDPVGLADGEPVPPGDALREPEGDGQT